MSGSPRRILGCDPGKSGALALMDGDGVLLDVADAPCLNDGPAGRAKLNAPMVAEIVQRWRPTEAFVEAVAAKSTDGTVGAFDFGRSAGVMDGVLAGMGIPVRHPQPVGWRRAVGLQAGADKDASRAEASRRWPSHAGMFKRKRDDGRAEACLIAAAGLKVPAAARP